LHSIELDESFPKHHSSPFYDHCMPRYGVGNEFRVGKKSASSGRVSDGEYNRGRDNSKGALYSPLNQLSRELMCS